jgi:uncharacterized membrane protein YdbT with pleckstrin-like domain
MDTVVLHPSGKYAVKLFIASFPLSLFILVLVFSARGGLGIAGVLMVIYLVIAFIGIVAYCASLRYEITPEEVVVHAGVITKTVRHVPFRTVTNLQVTRGLFDRILGMGSLSIQTAGSGSIAIPEEKLVGLTNVQEVYEYVANELRRFRGAMPPTQAGEEYLRRRGHDEQLLAAILDELRAIRIELGRRS